MEWREVCDLRGHRKTQVGPIERGNYGRALQRCGIAQANATSARSVHYGANHFVLNEFAPFAHREVGAPDYIMVGEPISAVTAQRFVYVHSLSYAVDRQIYFPYFTEQISIYQGQCVYCNSALHAAGLAK
jgi:hypothetical protein